MLPSHPEDTELKQALGALNVPQPNPMAQANLLREARLNPPKRWRFLRPFRQLRAWVLVPQMRYSIMTSVVLTVIGLGMLNSAMRTPSIPDDLLLYDVEFAEFDHSAIWDDNGES
jgi:hypothetical protein